MSAPRTMSEEREADIRRKLNKDYWNERGLTEVALESLDAIDALRAAYSALEQEYESVKEKVRVLERALATMELRAVGAEAHLCQTVGRLEFDAVGIGHKDHACADCGAENPHKGFYCIRHRAARYLDSLGLYDEDDLFPNGIETPLAATAEATPRAQAVKEVE